MEEALELYMKLLDEKNKNPEYPVTVRDFKRMEEYTDTETLKTLVNFKRETLGVRIIE